MPHPTSKIFVSRNSFPAFELGLMLLTEFSKIGVGNLNTVWLVCSPGSSIAAIPVYATAEHLIPLRRKK